MKWLILSPGPAVVGPLSPQLDEQRGEMKGDSALPERSALKKGWGHPAWAARLS